MTIQADTDLEIHSIRPGDIDGPELCFVGRHTADRKEASYRWEAGERRDWDEEEEAEFKAENGDGDDHLESCEERGCLKANGERSTKRVKRK